MGKRFLLFILVITMLSITALPAFAADFKGDGPEDEIVYYDDGSYAVISLHIEMPLEVTQRPQAKRLNIITQVTCRSGHSRLPGHSAITGLQLRRQQCQQAIPYQITVGHMIMLANRKVAMR